MQDFSNVSQGADVNINNAEGCIPIHCAAASVRQQSSFIERFKNIFMAIVVHTSPLEQKKQEIELL